MIHGRLLLLELVFLAELVHESVGELFFVVGVDVARHTISMNDMLFDDTDNSFLLDFPYRYNFSPLGEIVSCS